MRTAVRPHLRRHQALGARPEAHQYGLARAQFGDAEAAQGFHVDEDIRRPLAPGQEAKTAQAVEPLHLRALEAARRRDADVGARRRHLRRMDRGGFVHRQYAQRTKCIDATEFLHLWTSRHSHAAMKGASTEPMSSRTTRSAMSSNSVGSRLMIANRAPLRLAMRGNPAAGHTTRDDPIDRNRSQVIVRSSARRMAASGMDWPNDMVAVFIYPPQRQ